MPVVPFDPARARPRGQARPPKLPAPPTSAAPPRAPGIAGRSGAAARAPCARPVPRGARSLPPGCRAGTAMAPSTADGRAAAARSNTRWSSEPAGGVMMPAHVPPPTPRLAINLSPARRDARAVDAGPRRRAVRDRRDHAHGDRARRRAACRPKRRRRSRSSPTGSSRCRGCSSRSSWPRRRASSASSGRTPARPGPRWRSPPARCGAMQVVGRDLVSTWTLVTRAGLIVVATASLSLAFRQFLAGPSRAVRAQIVGGAFAGLLAGLGPFAMLGRLVRRRRRRHLRADRRAAERRRRAPRPGAGDRHHPRHARLRPRLPARLQHRARDRRRHARAEISTAVR